MAWPASANDPVARSAISGRTAKPMPPAMVAATIG
jgi:hypothetical protein